ncbi:MAG: hypothetical protein A3I11_03185 [Elusimicrobia bacterium RIFCSPLOWO2_02_FULL_39_32]|nr:MAG: hypothetical protein A3B80_01755 [Elusimicrobia bacterium RIFCSPHIGHO2_02_FULL_39_36]OGR92715.1 MAG: hypothetical protein A3I11_03185 [Elusimicrobia bacterium RIFCSPLOWO2_02_FULL_39_32]OGR99499.1 MAG: hypothetical protein A3G85_00540 [Elusimicrobia bacterium RIFCSPLOWO2_12_FULL_39_28]
MSRLEPIHYFTAEEVNVLIPHMEDHLQNFWALRQNAQDILHKLRKNQKEPEELNPKDIASQQMKTSQAHFLLEQAKKQLDAIVELGGTIKDLEIGLVDFPHMSEYEESEVYLCWKYGEKKVRFWHGVDEGYAARKPLAKKVSSH